MEWVSEEVEMTVIIIHTELTERVFAFFSNGTFGTTGSTSGDA